MARATSISKLQTGNADLDRVQEHLRQQLNPVLASLPSASDFRWVQLPGVDQTVADSWALQFRTTGTTWTTILSVTSAGQIAQQAWVAPTLGNSWVNFGAPQMTAGYMKDSLGFVHLRGILKNGTVTATAFTLPAGFRPSANRNYAVMSNNAFGALVVDSSGNVIPNVGSNVSFGLDGVTFDTRS